MIEVGKKYNERTLYRMRKFYEVFKSEKLTPLVSKLSWSHYIQYIYSFFILKLSSNIFSWGEYIIIDIVNF